MSEISMKTEMKWSCPSFTSNTHVHVAVSACMKQYKYQVYIIIFLCSSISHYKVTEEINHTRRMYTSELLTELVYMYNLSVLKSEYACVPSSSGPGIPTKKLKTHKTNKALIKLISPGHSTFCTITVIYIWSSWRSDPN